MRSVLLIDGCPKSHALWDVAFRRRGFALLAAPSAQDGLTIAESQPLDFALVNERLPLVSGADVLRVFRAARMAPPVIVVAQPGTTRAAVEAMRLGAEDYIEAPVDADVLAERVCRFVARPAIRHCAGEAARHSAARWAAMVVRVIGCPRDPRTLDGWAQAVAMSRGTVRGWCHAAGLSPKRSLDFARMLRATVRHQDGRLRPDELLDVVDRRTLRALLAMGRKGACAAAELPSTIEDFLEQQAWITDPAALREVHLACSVKSDHAAADGAATRPA
jgi:ActR/RegA family two-component response regulator